MSNRKKMGTVTRLKSLSKTPGKPPNQNPHHQRKRKAKPVDQLKFQMKSHSDPEEFYRMVKRMRQAQKKYFKSRSQEDLERAKRYEREVDEAISPQIDLFA